MSLRTPLGLWVADSSPGAAGAADASRFVAVGGVDRGGPGAVIVSEEIPSHLVPVHCRRDQKVSKTVFVSYC